MYRSLQLSRIASCMTPRTASLGVRYPVGGMVPPQRRCTSAPESLVNMDLESDVREVFQMEKVRDKGILTIPGKILEKTFHEDLDEVDASTYHDVIVGALHPISYFVSPGKGMTLSV